MLLKQLTFYNRENHIILNIWVHTEMIVYPSPLSPAGGFTCAAVCHEPYLPLHKRFTPSKFAEKFVKFGAPFSKLFLGILSVKSLVHLDKSCRHYFIYTKMFARGAQESDQERQA